MNHSKLILSLSCFVAVTLASPLVTAAPRGGGGGHGGGHFPGVVVSLGVPEWGQAAAAIGMAVATGMAVVTGMAVATGTVAIGTVITVTIMLSSSATSAFPAGGAGVGAGILTGATPITDTMITVTHTVTTATAMDINIPATAMGIPAGYGNNYGYGNGYGYSGGNRSQYASPTRSKVAELQRRLSRAGYYRGSVDGVLGPQTRRAIRAYESDHGYADAG